MVVVLECLNYPKRYHTILFINYSGYTPSYIYMSKSQPLNDN